ncbi:MAG: ATP-binding protein [Myxococcaceae bacterium]
MSERIALELRPNRIVDGFMACDAQWRFLHVNRSAAEFFERPSEALVGKIAWDVFPEFEGTEFENKLRKAAISGTWTFELPFDNRWLEFRTFKFEGVLAIYFHDVTVRKKEEDELKESEAAIRFLTSAGEMLNSSLDYGANVQALLKLTVPYLADLCILDMLEDGQLKRVGVADKDPQRGATVAELGKVTPDRASSTGVMKVLETGEALLIPRLTGDWAEAAARSGAALDLVRNNELQHSLILVPLIARGEKRGVMTLIRSPEARPYSERDLAIAKGLAHVAAPAIENARMYSAVLEAKQLRDEMLSIVSHDLRGPLQAIAASVSSVASVSHLPEIEDIRQSVERASRLIDDLLLAAMLESGHLPLKLEVIPLEPLITEALRLHRPLAVAKDIELQLMPLERMPPIPLDAHRILQVLSNLFGNAIKFTPKGGSVRVEAIYAMKVIWVSVNDTGRGIPEEHLPRLFDRFWQGARSNDAGAGLGLAIAKGIVEAHGGEIRVNSVVGKGSAFAFSLPVDPP